MLWILEAMHAHAAPLLALLAAAMTGTGIILAGFGLRHMDPRSAATVSIPTSALLYWVLLPVYAPETPLQWQGVAIFAAVGLVYPAAVTLLQNASYLRLGPTPTATISATAPVFAIAGALLLLREPLRAHTLAGAALLVSAILLVSLRGGGRGLRGTWTAAALALPIAAAVVRGFTQIGIKAGLELMPSPYMASLTGYTVSAALVLGLAAFRVGGTPVRLRRRGVPWFLLSGTNNGCALLALYTALRIGTVSEVAPIAASFPIFTALFSVLFFRTERITAHLLLGGLLVIAGVALVVR